MTYNFCTYFDKNYLIKGLALYRSLERNCDSFKLWILCLDNETHNILNKLNLKKAELITLSELENADPELLSIKGTRSTIGYFWTCTPCLTRHILKKNPSLETISYIDSDLYFFDSPKEIYQEFANNSVLVIPHRFAEKYKEIWEKTSGIFNIGLLIFRNDIEGKKCLEWWREKCLEWCNDVAEKGQCGDQKYADHFPEKFSGVHALLHKGAGLATWNIKNYKIKNNNKGVYVDGDKLIFFHFASFKIYPQSKYSLFSYAVPPGVFPYSRVSNAARFIYRPYAKALYNALNETKKIKPDFNYSISKRPTVFRQIARFGLQYASKIYNLTKVE